MLARGRHVDVSFPGKCCMRPQPPFHDKENRLRPRKTPLFRGVRPLWSRGAVVGINQPLTLDRAAVVAPASFNGRHEYRKARRRPCAPPFGDPRACEGVASTSASGGAATGRKGAAIA